MNTKCSRMELASLDEILGGVQAIRQPELQALSVDCLMPFPNHPYELYTGQRLEDLVDSIREHGILQPVIVWKKDTQYLILSGHNRVNAARIAGVKRIPVVLKEQLTDEEAMLIVTETNLKQRSMTDLTHTQRAQAIAAHYAATKAKGRKKELIEEIDAMLASGIPVGNKKPSQMRSIEKTGAAFQLSQGAIARYLRIHCLIPTLKEALDADKLPLRAAVELSWLEEEQQQVLAEHLQNGGKVSMAAAAFLRKQAASLTEETICEALGRRRTAVHQVPIRQSLYEQYFHDMKPKEAQRLIEQALELYFTNQNQ